MTSQLFTEMLSRATDPQSQSLNANEWLREQAKTVTQVRSPAPLLASHGSDRLVTQLTVGRLYLFKYDPKTKDSLPYYDMFPLIFPFKRVPGGFYGINMHYLPHMLRARLMDALYSLANNNAKDDTTKLRLSYQLLEASSRFRYFQPCVKRYLNTHIMSRFLWVPAAQWETALFLPLERFVGATKQKVWRESRRMVK